MPMLRNCVYILNYDICTDSIIRTLRMKTNSCLHQFATILETSNLKVQSLVSNSLPH